MAGTPLDFAPLIDRLDRTRFQPWVFYYPSGARLESLAAVLTQLFVRLRVQYGFDRAAVVAHSMGGLVTRGFLLQDYETHAADVVRTYVTISSPLGGMASAGKGVEMSPIVVRSWYGLAPGSEYLDGLFYEDPAGKTKRRSLPKSMSYHLLFGFRGSGPDDGIVALSSQLRQEAQEEARTERGFDETHTSILQSAAVADYLNGVLAALR
jgi:pimeloyl-ACP methyl ester carboxylesterase